MQIEVEQSLVLVRDVVHAGVQLRQRARVAGDSPRAPAEVGDHRCPVDELEHETVVAYLEDLRHPNTVRPGVLHDGRLARGFTVPLEAAEDAAVAEVEPSPGASGGDRSQLRS